jgi:hypothetical protein
VSQATPQLEFQLQERANYEWHLWAWDNVPGYSEYIMETQDYPFLSHRDTTPWYTQPNPYFANLLPSYPSYYPSYLFFGSDSSGLTQFNYYPFMQQDNNNLILLPQPDLIMIYFDPSVQNVLMIW